jgi:hypothetical protein
VVFNPLFMELKKVLENLRIARYSVISLTDSKLEVVDLVTIAGYSAKCVG